MWSFTCVVTTPRPNAAADAAVEATMGSSGPCLGSIGCLQTLTSGTANWSRPSQVLLSDKGCSVAYAVTPCIHGHRG